MTATFDGVIDMNQTSGVVTYEKEANRKRPARRVPNPWVNSHWTETAGMPFLTARQHDALDAIRAAYPQATVDGDTVTIPGVSLTGATVTLEDVWGPMVLPVLFAGAFEPVTEIDLGVLAN